MLYAYAAIAEGIPYINGAPNLSADIPALVAFPCKIKMCRLPGKILKPGRQ